MYSHELYSIMHERVFTHNGTICWDRLYILVYWLGNDNWGSDKYRTMNYVPYGNAKVFTSVCVRNVCVCFAKVLAIIS